MSGCVSRRKRARFDDGRGKERPIHGQTDFDEARALIEEGIEIFPVPSLPDKFN